MYSRHRLLLVATGVAATAGLVATPASASVAYDPEDRTGFVDGADVRSAFGWTDAVLAARAAGIVFDHEFETVDTYTVTCRGGSFPVEHHRVFGRFELDDVVVREGRGGAGYRGGPSGFRLTGARFGISGTSVPPAPGQPCPREENAPIEAVRLVSTASGWTLTATSDGTRRELAGSAAATGQAAARGGAAAPVTRD